MADTVYKHTVRGFRHCLYTVQYRLSPRLPRSHGRTFAVLVHVHIVSVFFNHSGTHPQCFFLSWCRSSWRAVKKALSHTTQE